VKYADLAYTVPCCVLVGYGIGYGLDRIFHTTYLYIVFVILGSIAGLAALVRAASVKR
jgi:F0F1-type ATP synthase assembly protein I